MKHLSRFLILAFATLLMAWPAQAEARSHRYSDRGRHYDSRSYRGGGRYYSSYRYPRYYSRSNYSRSRYYYSRPVYYSSPAYYDGYYGDPYYNTSYYGDPYYGSRYGYYGRPSVSFTFGGLFGRHHHYR